MGHPALPGTSGRNAPQCRLPPLLRTPRRSIRLVSHAGPGYCIAYRDRLSVCHRFEPQHGLISEQERDKPSRAFHVVGVGSAEAHEVFLFLGNRGGDEKAARTQRQRDAPDR